MDDDDRELLQKSLELAEENHRLLKKLLNHNRLQAAWGWIKIALVVLPLAVAWFYLQPYFQKISDTYSAIQGVQDKIPQVPSAGGILDQIKNILP